MTLTGPLSRSGVWRREIYPDSVVKGISAPKCSYCISCIRLRILSISFSFPTYLNMHIKLIVSKCIFHCSPKRDFAPVVYLLVIISFNLILLYCSYTSYMVVIVLGIHMSTHLVCVTVTPDRLTFCIVYVNIKLLWKYKSFSLACLGSRWGHAV